MMKTTSFIPSSITLHGYCKLPEWLIYYLKPNSLLIIREIKKTLKRSERVMFSDITNEQLAERCGLSTRYISQLIQKLVDSGYIKRRTVSVSKTKRRRKIYFCNLRKKKDNKLRGRSYYEVLITKCFTKCKRIEENKIATDNWLDWIPIPHGLKNGYELKVFGVLIGQNMRGMNEIKLSDRQIASMMKIDRTTVANVLASLGKKEFIKISKNNKRSRIIMII